MAAVSSEKIDIITPGPAKPIVENGFSDQFVLHHYETTHDLERLPSDVAARARGMAITDNTVRGDTKTLGMFPKLEIVAAFGVGYDHVDANYAREHNIMVTNTPDVLTEEVADIAMGLLICTLREFVKADKYLRSGPLADHAAIPAERRLAARPQGRHGRHGPDRAGDRWRAILEGLQGAGGLSQPQPGQGRLLQALPGPDRDGEGRGHADRDRAGRRARPK